MNVILYGATFTPHICTDKGIGGSGQKCIDLMVNNISSSNPKTTGCAKDGCQSKSIDDDSGKQWFGLNPTTGNIIKDGVDPREYFTIKTTFTMDGGMTINLNQGNFNKTVFDMQPINGCPTISSKCDLPYYGCDNYTTKATCDSHAGDGINDGRESGNLCNWEKSACNSWGGTDQWPSDNTFGSFAKQLHYGMMIVGGIWGEKANSWINNISNDQYIGNNDITKASISFRNMSITSNQ